MRTRPFASLAPLRGRPARLPRIDATNERAPRLRNPFSREPVPPRPGCISAHRGRAREAGDLREPRVPAGPRPTPGSRAARVARHDDRGSGPRAARAARARVAGLRSARSAPKDPAAPKSVPPTRPPPGWVPIAVPTRDPARRPNDGSRTWVAFPGTGEDFEEITTRARTFSLREIASGLRDDSREEDERAEAQRLRDLRGRVTLIPLNSSQDFTASR